MEVKITVATPLVQYDDVVQYGLSNFQTFSPSLGESAFQRSLSESGLMLFCVFLFSPESIHRTFYYSRIFVVLLVGTRNSFSFNPLGQGRERLCVVHSITPTMIWTRSVVVPFKNWSQIDVSSSNFPQDWISTLWYCTVKFILLCPYWHHATQWATF